MLEVNDLRTYYYADEGIIRAVDGVSLQINEMEKVGLCGESGCGKSTLGMSILNCVTPPGRIVSGHVLLKGVDMLKLSPPEMQAMRWKSISVVTQSAMMALDPLFRVREQIVETILAHEKVSRNEALSRAGTYLERVGIHSQRWDSYPHEYSGGMRQRAMIAMALACEPTLVIGDEPTTALDVLVQSQVLRLVKDLCAERRMALLLISHDISVVAETCDTIAIMYAGRIVEKADVPAFFKQPMHPYSLALLGSFPALTGPKKRLASIPGYPPRGYETVVGCSFQSRCSFAKDLCRSKEPVLREVSKNHFAACHFAEELSRGE
jgi:peptide/nickel transport system ATP-binding protein